MPIITKHYGLVAFTSNDIYRSKDDKSRFTIIDNHLDFISGLVGEGIINGWEVTDVSQSSNYIISVSSGLGMIDRYITRTFGDIQLKIDSNSTTWVYMQKKLDYLGGFGGYSVIGSIIYHDSTPPPVPSFIDATSWDYNYITLEWDSSPSSVPDFEEYRLYRSTDGFVTSELVASVSSDTYTDNSVLENTTYKYRVTSVDMSGNESTPSIETPDITTLKDLRSPLDVTYLLVFPGDQFVDIMWKGSSSDNIDQYSVKIEELNNEYEVVGTIDQKYVSSDTLQLKVDGLANGVFYKFTIYSVSHNSVLSLGISTVDAPRSNLGPLEVYSISINSQESTKNQYGVSLYITWIPGADPYSTKPSVYRYVVTLIENGLTESEPFYVYDRNNLLVELFYSNGEYRPILPKTDYIVKIESEDEQGNRSNAVVSRSSSLNYLPPSSHTSLSYFEDTDGNIHFSWQNTSSDFSHTVLRFVRTDLSTNVDTVIENDIDYGRETIYILYRSSIVLNSKYTLSITAVDDFSLVSDTNSTEYTSPSSLTGNISVPTNVKAYKGDGCVSISWDAVTSVHVAYYKIWRADYRPAGVGASSYALIDTIPGTYTNYNDLSVINSGRYLYFITTVDVYGRQSKNPIDDDYASYAKIFGYAQWDTTFAPIEDVSVTDDGYDAIISWTPNSDNFDGYEIYRSVGGKYNWTKVGTALKDASIFIDENALLVNGTTYYYTLRKFRNEAIVITNHTGEEPVRSLLLAKVTTYHGNVVIDSSVAEQIRALLQVATDFLNSTLPFHKHSLAERYDRRIDLSKSVIVTEWTTKDQQEFTTDQYIEGATAYIPLVEDTTLSYEVTPSEGRIIFSKPIGTDSLSLECVGLTETQGILDSGRVGDLSATQIYSGRVPIEQLDEISHAGSSRSELVPLQLPMITNDGYAFSIYQNSLGMIESLGSAITFYDMIRLTDDSFVTVTSSGIFSNSTGEWTVILQTDECPHKIYYASSIEQYFILTSKSVYISADALTWVKCNGITDINAIRDIVDDDVGNVYITTDKGVYKLDIDSGVGEFLQWTQCGFVSEISSDTYACFWDTDRLVVSGESVIYYSDDYGDSFTYSSEINSDEIIRSFFLDSGFVFALTDTSVWRRNIGSAAFEKIAHFDADKARKFVIFENRLFISTDFGLYVSSTDNDIFSDVGIGFEKSLKEINFSYKTVIVTGLSVTGSYINIGVDNKLFSGLSSIDLVEDYSGSSTIPSVYVDNAIQAVGFTYYNVDNTVWFDEPIGIESQVTVANQYKMFRSQEQGWLDKRYLADVNVYKNGTLLVTAENSGVPVISPFDQVQFDDFTEFDSNSETAKEYSELFDAELVVLHTQYNAGNIDLQPSVTKLVDLYYKTYSQVLGNVRFTSTVSVDEKSYVVFEFQKIPYELYTQMLSEYEIVPNLTSLTVSEATAAVSGNIVDGYFEFTDSYNKYDLISVDIKNTAFYGDDEYTHTEIEDSLEEINSGLPLLLSETQQTNLIKASLFMERIWPGEQQEVDQCLLDTNSLYNMEFFVPTSNTWYDTLNSSVDYKKETIFDTTNVSVDYVTSVLYVPNSSMVLVGSPTGLISISTTDLSISPVDFNGGEVELVSDLKMIDSIIYIITNYSIYKSTNDGYSWKREEETPGLTGKFKLINKIGDNFVMATTDGLFYKSLVSGYWEKELTISNINILCVSSYIVAISNGNKVYYSRNGIIWEEGGEVSSVRVNMAHSYKRLLILGTDKGLRLDNSTFYTQSPATSLIDIENNLADSEDIKINDIAFHTTKDEYVAVASDGRYFVWNGSVYTEYDSELETIQKVVCVGDDYWFFGYDKMRVMSLSYVVKLSSGIPF